MHYLSLTAILRNEDYWVKEWLSYYKAIGVEKFYIYVHNDIITEEKIKELSFLSDITIISLPDVIKNWGADAQAYAYANSVKENKNKTEWMIFCDGDEFFMPTEPTDLKVFLQPYEEFSGLGVPWKMFGSSSYTTRPVQPHGCNALGSFLKCSKTLSTHIKSIVKPREVIRGMSPHVFKTLKGTVLETKEFLKEEEYGVIKGIIPTIDTIRVNHYVTRSFEDWTIKCSRPYWSKGNKRAGKFNAFNARGSVDTLSLQYIDNTSKILNIK